MQSWIFGRSAIKEKTVFFEFCSFQRESRKEVSPNSPKRRPGDATPRGPPKISQCGERKGVLLGARSHTCLFVIAASARERQRNGALAAATQRCLNALWQLEEKWRWQSSLPSRRKISTSRKPRHQLKNSPMQKNFS